MNRFALTGLSGGICRLYLDKNLRCSVEVQVNGSRRPDIERAVRESMRRRFRIKFSNPVDRVHWKMVAHALERVGWRGYSRRFGRFEDLLREIEGC